MQRMKTVSDYGIQSDFYRVWHNILDGRRVTSPVFDTDEAHHAVTKRPIASAYQLSTLVEFEPFVDSTTAVLFSRLDELFANSGRLCDLGHWLQLYAFDVIGELTFSRRLGFLQQGDDVEGVIQSITTNFGRCSVLGQMPWLDLISWKNPIYTKFFARAATSPIITFGRRRMLERLDPDVEEETDTTEILDPELREKDLGRSKPSKPDFLARFLALRESHPDIVTEQQTLAYLFVHSTSRVAPLRTR